MYYIYIFIVINIISCSLMGWDKYCARKHKWRVPEKVLFGWAFLFGATGAYLGMKNFHHKTLHNTFRYGFPTLMIIQWILIVSFLLKYRIIF